MEILQDGQWFSGLDSINYYLPEGTYQWSQNTSNTGGILQTRQGLAQLAAFLNLQPKGIILYQDAANVVYIVIAIGDSVYKIPAPFTAAPVKLPGITIPTTTRNIQFEIGVQAQYTNTSGEVIVLANAKRVLIIQDGVSLPWYWDGINSGKIHDLYPTQTTTPVARFMKWVGGRLWTTQSGRVRASDLLNPLQFIEEETLASGGFFYLPAQATGMGVTHDYKSLMVMTDQTTTAFQAGLEDRTQWPLTQDFQRVIFPNIGCASHRTIVTQYGVTWWMSHDGLVGLDNALQAYVTSVLHIRDQNMARSKSGIGAWWQDNGYAGCSGTYGNFMFVSVPSGSNYNVHTWVMDGGVVNTLNQVSPPAWSSNWTGIRPEQWVTGVIDGVQRCFCLSHDLVPEGRQATVWEAFTGQREDAPKGGRGGLYIPKDIACAFETKFYPLGKYARFRWVELDLAEISGVVNLAVYYCGRRTSYKKILSKRLNAQTEALVDPPIPPPRPPPPPPPPEPPPPRPPPRIPDGDGLVVDTLVSSLIPQYRTVRAVSDSYDPDDLNSEVQTAYIRSRDKEFSILVTWTGKMAITAIRIAVDPEGDYTEGVCEEDEDTIRRIDASGSGEITDDPVVPNKVNTSLLKSQYLAPVTPRWIEFPMYSSAVANDVFFVVIPAFTPPPHGYPANEYPKDVVISTETPGARLSYTMDGTEPTATHGTIVEDSTETVSVPIDTTLKARAFRDGLLDSAVASGVYSKLTAGIPVFTPAAGAYHESEFPKLVTITSSTVGASKRYTLDGTTPTETHGTVYATPVSVAVGKTLKAIAYKADYFPSAVTSGTYTKIASVSTPVFAPDGGSFATFPVSVLVSITTIGGKIMYTLDGSTPTSTHGTLIDNTFGHVSVDSGKTLKAIGIKSGLEDSLVKSATYTPIESGVGMPTFTPNGGVFGFHNINVVLDSVTSGSQVSYTTDGTTPTPTHGIIVANHSTISFFIGTVILKAMAFKAGMTNSGVRTATYEFDVGGGG